MQGLRRCLSHHSLVIPTLCPFTLASLSGSPGWQEAPRCNLPGSDSVERNVASLSNSSSSKSLISYHFITHAHQVNPMILPVKLSHMPTSRARDSSRLSEPGRQAEAAWFPSPGEWTQQSETSRCLPAGLDVPVVFTSLLGYGPC